MLLEAGEIRRRHIEAKQLFPFSQLTLCRSALVGAAQAVWVLAPDTSHMRVRRARAVAAYLYKKQNQYLKDLRDLLDAPDKNTDAAAEFAAARFDELQAKRAADGQKQVDLDTTDMIRSAAIEAFGSDDLTKNAVLAWRAGSGTAHGLMWPLFGTPAMQQAGPSGDDGLANFHVAGTLSVIANPYCAAFWLGQRGWSLLHERGCVRAEMSARPATVRAHEQRSALGRHRRQQVP